MAANVLAAQKRAIKEKLQSSQDAKKREANYGSIKATFPKANLLAATKLQQPAVKKDLMRLCLIAPQSTFHKYWDIFIMILALYNGVTLPIEISFDPAWMQLDIASYVNSLIDISFLLDIIVVFRTTITGMDGEENTNQKQIAKNYLKGSFFIDIMSTIPMDSLAALFLEPELAANFALFGALKLIRVTRLGRIIRGMSVDRQLKGQLKLFKLMFMLCLYVHCVGCMWYYFNKREMTWVPPQDTIYADESERPFWRYGLFDQYWFCVYISLQFLCCNDVLPQSTNMIAFGALANLGGALVTANLFGELAILVGDLGRNATRYQKKVDNANQAMQNLHLPVSVQNQVLSYMMSTKASQDSQDEFKEFAVLISPTLAAQITRSLFTMICHCSKLIGPSLNLNDKILQEELGFIGAMLEPNELCPEDIVVNQGDFSNFLFFVLKGRLKVKIVNNFNNQIQMMPELDKYQVFGEVAYVLKVARTATVQCDNYVSLMQMHHAPGYNFPKLNELLKQQYFQYNENFLKFAKKLLRRSVIWLDDPIVDDSLLQSICYNLKQVSFKKGQVILYEGATITELIIIQQGFIDCTFKTSLVETSCIQRLYTGCAYGSFTFFVDEENENRHSKFNLVAVTDGSYLALSYQSLFSLNYVDEKMTDLIAKYRTYLLDEGFPHTDFSLFRANMNIKRRPNELFVMALRKVFLINKRKRAKLEMLQRLIVQARENKERLMQQQLPKKLAHQLSTKVHQYFMTHDVDIVGPLEQCQQEMICYQESVTRAFAIMQNEMNRHIGNAKELVANIVASGNQ